MTCRYIRHSLIKFGLDSWAYINNVSSSSWASRDEICSCKHATDLLSPRSSVHHLKRCHSASTNAFLRDNQADVHDVGIYSFWIRLLEGRPLYFNCWISCFICRHTHTSNVRSELLLNDPPPGKITSTIGRYRVNFKKFTRMWQSSALNRVSFGIQTNCWNSKRRRYTKATRVEYFCLKLDYSTSV